MAYQILWEYSVKSIRNAFINQYGGNALPSANKKKRLPEMEAQLKQEIVNNIQQAPDGVGRLNARVTPRKGGTTVPAGLLASYSPLCVLRANTPCLPPQSTQSSEDSSEKENTSCFCVRTNSASPWWSRSHTGEENRSQDVYMEICVAVGSIAVHFHDLGTNLDTQTFKAKRNERRVPSSSTRNVSDDTHYSSTSDPFSKQAKSGEQGKDGKETKNLEISHTPRNVFSDAHVDKLSHQVRDFAGHLQKLGFMPEVSTDRVVKSFKSIYVPFLEQLYSKHNPSPTDENFKSSDLHADASLQTAGASIATPSPSKTTGEKSSGKKQRKKDWKVPITEPCEAGISADQGIELSTLTNTDVKPTGCIRIYPGTKFSIEVKSDLAVFWYEMRYAAAKQRTRTAVPSMNTQHSKAWITSSLSPLSSRYLKGSLEAEEKLSSYLRNGGGSLDICQELTPLEKTAKMTNHQLCPLFLQCSSQECGEEVAAQENSTSFSLGVKRKNEVHDSGDHAKVARSSEERDEGTDFATFAGNGINENKDLETLYNNRENDAVDEKHFWDIPDNHSETNGLENNNQEEEEGNDEDDDDGDDDEGDDDEGDEQEEEEFEEDEESDDGYLSETSG